MTMQFINRNESSSLFDSAKRVDNDGYRSRCMMFIHEFRVLELRFEIESSAKQFA